MKFRELTAPPLDAQRDEEIAREEPAAQRAIRVREQLERLPKDRPGRHLAPLGLVALAVGFNLWVLRTEILPVLNFNDSAVHLSMVRWALQRIQDGHIPFDGWYPYLGLGSSLFHHYQSLPHILTGTLGLAIGPDRAFFGALYVLLASWPISVYLGARLFGWERWVAAGAAVLSPLVAGLRVYSSWRGGYGFEYGSYSWLGLGLWSQMWAMWLLPLAIGLSWRAVSGKTPARYAVTALIVGLTAACHFLTGYLALLALGVWVVIRPSEFVKRLGKAALIGAGALLIISWVVVPLLMDGPWTSQSEFRQGTALFDSFGAPKVLGWLLSGQLFDAGRPPIITALVAVGTLICIVRFRKDERARALLGFMGLSMILFSGRPTFGPLLNLLPGSDDLLLHRFIMGVHLAGILLAGVGGVWIVVGATSLLRRKTPSVPHALRIAAIVAVASCVLAPTLAERRAFGRQAVEAIRAQRTIDSTDGAAIRSLVETAKARNPGRIYGGSIMNWGLRERFGDVPVYAALLGYDADAIGFVGRTTSLSSDFEFEFDDANPAHYELFAVRYLILPDHREPKVAATEVERRDGYTLYEVETGGYFDVVDTVAPPIEADRTNLLTQAGFLMEPNQAPRGRYPTIAFAGAPAAEPTLEEGSTVEGPAGSVVVESVALTDGVFVAEVVTDRDAVVVLRSSFDPRWRVKVDGERVDTQMVAPSFVGAAVPPGRHTVAFRYQPFPRYDLLFAIGALAFFGLWVVSAFVVNPRARQREASG